MVMLLFLTGLGFLCGGGIGAFVGFVAAFLMIAIQAER
jgi:hypothetical protein